MSDIYTELTWRELIYQSTDNVNMATWLAEKPRTLYIGFDPTADSLHVGHLVAMMVLRRFQQAGHRPIALVGGATGMIGDPSGKSEERNLLSVEVLRANVAVMETQLRRFLDFDCGTNSAVLVNNYDWMGRFGYLEFLRDIGKHFPVNVMLTKDSVRARLERTDAGLSYTEFSYMLLQAYDFVYLNQQYGCELQAGGSDQWGNITAGIDLARRIRGAQLYGITFPLLTKSDGSKMGKTESGSVWLSKERTTESQFYQYWINLDDADVGRCLRLLTELTESEIVEVEREHQADPGKRTAQRRLAREVTRLVHGDEGLVIAERAVEVMFPSGRTPLTSYKQWRQQRQATPSLPEFPEWYNQRQAIEGLPPLDELEKERDATRYPTWGEWFAQREIKAAEDAGLVLKLPLSRLDGEGLLVVDAMVEAKLSNTKSEARRLIQQGGAYAADQRVTSIDARLTRASLPEGSTIQIRAGKKKHALLRFV